MSGALDDPWEQEAAAQHLADEIVAVVMRAREAVIDDEALPAQLQDAVDALREGLT